MFLTKLKYNLYRFQLASFGFFTVTGGIFGSVSYSSRILPLYKENPSMINKVEVVGEAILGGIVGILFGGFVGVLLPITSPIWVPGIIITLIMDKKKK